jgi:hypothetical protein
VPVELRYETIVVEDGKLHIFRDVYDQDTNNEANLRAVLLANGLNLEDLDEREEVLDAVNAMSRHPRPPVRSPVSKPSSKPSPSASPSVAEKSVPAGEKVAAKSPRKPIGKNQKEVVIESSAFQGKGYPEAVNLDTGSGKPAAKMDQTKAPE